MVIICGSEDTSNSKIVAFLEKYRRPPIPLMSDLVLLPYLQEKLKVTNQNYEKEDSVYPAGNVDFERYIGILYHLHCNLTINTTMQPYIQIPLLSTHA